MILFLIEKGVTVQFSDIMDIWIWRRDPELAKRAIKSAPKSIQGFSECAEAFLKDKSICGYGGLEERERNAFNDLAAYLAEVKNLPESE